MTTRWDEVKDLFAEAVELSPAKRLEFLDARCAEHPSLRREVLSLLAAADDPENLIEDNSIDLAAQLDGSRRSIGQQIGPWRIVREIGSGGMGAVFLAERVDGDFEQQAAVKLIRNAIVESDVLRRFREERQILARLQHPGIAVLLDGGVSEDGQPYLAMEYVRGEPITDACRELSIDERLRIFLQVCGGVAYAHRNLVVHRDIKPSNILVDSDRRAKLLDFGLAKIVDDSLDALRTLTAFRALTPAYASPEQLSGETVTTASDIYSLGVVLYEMLTGVRPFATEGKSFDEIIRTVRTVDAVPPSRASQMPDRSRLKGDLDNIVALCLRKEPDRRYRSVDALAADIEDHLDGLTVSARPSTLGYRISKLYKRNKIAALSAGFVLLAIIAGLVASLYQGNVARQQRDRAESERQKAERINGFLQQMLSFSNQSYTSVSPFAQSKNVTVNEMLDQITPAIESEFADQPELRATVLKTIGSSYASQGAYDQAERALKASLEARQEASPNPTVEAADTMIELGVLNYRQSKFQESRKLLEVAVDFYRRYQAAHPENSPAKLIQALDFLGANRFYGGDLNEAKELFEEGMTIAASATLVGHEREVVAGIEADYCLIVTKLGDNARGEALARDAIAIYNSISTQPRWEVGNARAVLSLPLSNQGKIAEALAELRESERVISLTLGEKNLYMASTLKGQANILLQQNSLKDAEERARRSLAILRELYPQDNAFTVGSLVTLGNVLTRSGQVAEAYQTLKRASDVASAHTNNPAIVVPVRLALIDNLSARRQKAEALDLALRTLDETKTALGEQSAFTTQVQNAVDRLRRQN